MRSAECGSCGAAVHVRGGRFRRCGCGYAGSPVVRAGRFRPRIARYTEAPERRSLGPEVRSFAALAECRADGDVITGTAALYDQASALLDDGAKFIEVLGRGCFDGAIVEGCDIFCRVDHTVMIGSTSLGNLICWTDAHGLHYAVRPRHEDRAVLTLVRSGLIGGSSFAFAMGPGSSERWGVSDRGMRVREIADIGALVDVAPVRTPAYPDAGVGLYAA